MIRWGYLLWPEETINTPNRLVLGYAKGPGKKTEDGYNASKTWYNRRLVDWNNFLKKMTNFRSLLGWFERTS